MTEPPTTRLVEVEPMTQRTFAPFGVVLTSDPDRRPDYADADSTGWRHLVAMVGTPELVVVRTSYVGRRFSRLERHVGVAQAFFPVGGVAAAVAVATADDPLAPPSAEDVRAFSLTSGVGYLFHETTWHSVDRYPLVPGSIEVVMLTSANMTEEAMHADPADWRLTREVDYAQVAGVIFELVSV